MLKFLQLTDLHVKGTASKEYVSLMRIVDHILNHYSPATHPVILVTGDFVHHGKKTEYQNANAQLSKLVNAGYRLLACPGNHDFGQGTPGNYNHYQNTSRELYFTQVHNTLLSENLAPDVWAGGNTPFPQTYTLNSNGKNYLFIGLDTMHGVLPDPSPLATGKVDDAQFNRLDALLSDGAYANHVKIVYMHHHLFSDRLTMYLQGRDALQSLLDLRSVDLVCFGHLHRFGMWNNLGNIKLAVCGDKMTDTMEEMEKKHLAYHEFVIDAAGNCSLINVDFEVGD